MSQHRKGYIGTTHRRNYYNKNDKFPETSLYLHLLDLWTVSTYGVGHIKPTTMNMSSSL